MQHLKFLPDTFAVQFRIKQSSLDQVKLHLIFMPNDVLNFRLASLTMKQWNGSICPDVESRTSLAMTTRMWEEKRDMCYKVFSWIFFEWWLHVAPQLWNIMVLMAKTFSNIAGPNQWIRLSWLNKVMVTTRGRKLMGVLTTFALQILNLTSPMITFSDSHEKLLIKYLANNFWFYKEPFNFSFIRLT